MYTHIMVPVDLAHVETLDKALRIAADLAKHYSCAVTYVGVTMSAPTSTAHNPAEFDQKLAAFAKAQAAEHGHEARSRTEVSHDPTIDLDATLLKTIHAVGADLVVMQSHVPGLADHLWPSNGGTIATRSDASVLIVR